MQEPPVSSAHKVRFLDYSGVPWLNSQRTQVDLHDLTCVHVKEKFVADLAVELISKEQAFVYLPGGEFYAPRTGKIDECIAALIARAPSAQEE
jgi:hypothetical protein